MALSETVVSTTPQTHTLGGLGASSVPAFSLLSAEPIQDLAQTLRGDNPPDFDQSEYRHVNPFIAHFLNKYGAGEFQNMIKTARDSPLVKAYKLANNQDGTVERVVGGVECFNADSINSIFFPDNGRHGETFKEQLNDTMPGSSEYEKLALLILCGKLPLRLNDIGVYKIGNTEHSPSEIYFTTKIMDCVLGGYTMFDGFTFAPVYHFSP